MKDTVEYKLHMIQHILNDLINQACYQEEKEEAEYYIGLKLAVIEVLDNRREMHI